MESVRAYRFRVYPDAKRRREIDERLVLAKDFYNLLLENAIKAYKENGSRVTMASLNRFAKEIEKEKRFLRLYSQTRCEIKYRILKAYHNFFRRTMEEKKGKRVEAGFPRFKSIGRYRSITYPQDNGSFSIEKDRLRVSRIGTMKIKLHRRIEGRIKTLAIKRESGEYYAIFTTVKGVEAPKVQGTNPVGIDLGLESFIAMSDGTKIKKPRFFKKREKRIARWQRIIARRNKGSKGREKARLRLQKEWDTATRQSDDFMRKLSDGLVGSGYTSFAVEALNISNMARNHRLARAIYAASWNRFVQFLTYKAESAGMWAANVDPRNTTQECSRCHNIKKEEGLALDGRVYSCSACGLVIDRDVNSAVNILSRRTAGHAGSYAREDLDYLHQETDAKAGPVKREHTLESRNLDSKGSPGL